MYVKTFPKVPQWGVISRKPRKGFLVCERQPENVRRDDISQLSLWAQLEPAWLAMKMLGLLPIFMPQPTKGRPMPEGSKVKRVAVFLLQATYAVGFYVALLTIASTKGADLRGDNGSQEKITTPWIILKLMAITILIPHSLIAPLLWLRMSHILRFFKDWDTLQVQFLEATRHPLQLNMRRRSMVVITVVLAGSFVVSYALAIYFLLKDDYRGTVFIIYAFVQIDLLLAVWVLLCQTTVKAADQLAKRFKNEFQKSGAVGDQVIYGYHRVWLRLRQLTRDIGSIFYSAFNVIVMFWLALLLLSAFQSVIFLSNNCPIGQQSGVIVLAVLSLGSINIFCQSASLATEAVSDNFMNYLVDIKVDKRNLQKQLQDFEQAVGLLDAVISMGGYFDVNRGLVVSMLTAFVTYLIVLFQSTSASDSNDCGTDDSDKLRNMSANK